MDTRKTVCQILGLVCLGLFLQDLHGHAVVARGQTVEWVQRPEAVSRREGENVTFVCRLNSDDPNIIWVKDDAGGNTILFAKSDRFEADKRFSVVNKYDLVIANISKKDNGVYTCRTKDAGIQSATLTVLLYPGAPRISRDDQGPVYTEGSTVRFTCSSSGGNPKPSVTWLKNGNLSSELADVRDDGVVGGTINSTITVTMDKSDDRANYSCLVYNELSISNKMMDTVVLSVMYSPSIAFRPYSPVYTVMAGESADITCDVDANPPVNSVTWLKDGVRLSGNSPRRKLTMLTKANHGNYTCSARNSVGERAGSLEVNVQYAPIVNVPSFVTVNEGGDVTVTCDVDANPPAYELHWFRSSESSPQPIVNSRVLRLSKIDRTGAGNYTCRAQSQLRASGRSAEFVSSEGFTYIYVQYKPGPASLSLVPDLDVGTRLDITCTATPRGFPEASYSWTKDGQSLMQNKQTLSVPSVSLNDNGHYRCTPSNARGSGESAGVDVRVYEPPSIIKGPQAEMSVYLTDANPLNLTCVAKGYPQPRVLWFQEGENYPLNTRADLFTVITKASAVDGFSVAIESTLQFRGTGRSRSSQTSQPTNLQIRDMGNYSCQAESDKHSDKPVGHTRLLINFPPVLEATPTRLAVNTLDKAELACSAQAHPDPVFLWYFQGHQQVSGRAGVVITQESLAGVGRTRSKLTVQAVADRSYGPYRCVVSNMLGNSTQEIMLSKKSVPEPPGNLTATSTTWESVMLTWMPGFDGGHSQTFYIHKSGGPGDVQRLQVSPVSAPSFNVTKLHPSSTYTFQVVAENQLGASPSSQTLVATTQYLQIPSQPKLPVFDARSRKLVVTSPSQTNDYCLRVEVKSGTGTWSPVNGCIKVVGDSLEIAQAEVVVAVNVSVCLSHRSDVCGPPVSAEIYSTEKEATLTEVHVIIIACVCGFIIICLLIVLFCFIFRRRRNAAKAYHGSNQGDPPPYSAVPPNKKPQVYDNQGMDTSDLQLTTVAPGIIPMAPPADTPFYMHAPHHNSFTNFGYNAGMDGYPNQDAHGGPSIAQSPSKDKYIGLQDRGAGEQGLVGNEGGYSTTDLSAISGKPKKVIYEVVV